MIIQIAAASENNVLGKNNDLIWHLPDDFKRFKQITTGNYIIMGRKTFESFPKPLPNRTHIIITRQKNYSAPEGCIVVNSIENAILSCPKDQPIYIVGGAEIYKQSLPLTDKIELTRVHTHSDGDAFYPEINEQQWKITHQEFHPKDEKHAFDFTFVSYIKR